jgi:hypothetical protein
MMRNLLWLTDAQLTQTKPIFPKNHGKPCVDGQGVLCKVLCNNRIGLRRHDAPKECGLPTTLYNRYKRSNRNEIMFGRLKD